MSQTKTPWGKFSVYLTNICLMMVILMVSSPALPYITSEFGVTAAMAPWQNTLYTMSGAILSPVMGWIGDTKGAKKQMLSGIIIFIVGNLLCAVSPNFLVFCLGRFFAGFGLAAVMPATMNFISTKFPAENMAGGFAIMGAAMALGSGVGPMIAGVLMTLMTWRTLFLACTVAMVLGLLLVIIFVEKSESGSNTNSKLDIIGMITLFVGVGALLSLLTLSSTMGWTSPVVLGLMVVTVVSLVLFYMHEKKSSVKLMEISLLANRRFIAPAVMQFVQTALTGFLTSAVAYYFAAGLFLDSSMSGYWMSVFFLVTFPCSFVVGKLTAKLGAKAMTLIAIITWAIGLASFAFSTPETPLWILFVVGGAVPAIGNAINTGISNAVALKEVPAEQTGVASGTLQMIMNIGAPVAVAIFVPYLSIVGSQDGIPNYLESFSVVSQYMFVFIAIALAMFVIYPNDKKEK